jgi:hypothetical protein
LLLFSGLKAFKDIWTPYALTRVGILRADKCLPDFLWCGTGLHPFAEVYGSWFFFIVLAHFLAFALLYAQSFMPGGGSWLRALSAFTLAVFHLLLAAGEACALEGAECGFWFFSSRGCEFLLDVRDYLWDGYLFLVFAALAGGTGLALALKKGRKGASSAQKESSSLASAQSLVARVFLVFWLAVPALVLACVAWGAGKPVVRGFAIPQVDASRCPVLWAEEPCLAGLIELALLVFLGAWLGLWMWVGQPSVGTLGVFLLACWGMMVGLFGFFGWPWLDLGLSGFFLGEYPWPLAKNQPLWLALAGLCWLGASWVLARSARRAESR